MTDKIPEWDAQDQSAHEFELLVSREAEIEDLNEQLEEARWRLAQLEK